MAFEDCPVSLEEREREREREREWGGGGGGKASMSSVRKVRLQSALAESEKMP